MTKTTATYWPTLGPESTSLWQPVKGLEGIAEELTLSIDEKTGEYTKLTRFHRQRPGRLSASRATGALLTANAGRA